MKKLIAVGSTFLFPMIALAQTGIQGTDSGTFLKIMAQLKDIIGTVLPIVLTIGIITFFWGVIQYITAGADEEKRGQARQLMIYGVIGVFVMVSVFGLVALIGRSFGIGSGGSANVPTVPNIKSLENQYPGTR